MSRKCVGLFMVLVWKIFWLMINRVRMVISVGLVKFVSKFVVDGLLVFRGKKWKNVIREIRIEVDIILIVNWF